MKAFLKCYYGYQNRGDELLFFGVIAYLFEHYEDLTHLDVECGNVSWMNQWCELNYDLWSPYQDKVRFVSSRKLTMWITNYDIIYLGGGEVLATKTRSFWHGGVNYLALCWRWIWSGRVVWLGGIETPGTWWSKLLYRMMLPYAREIVCREQGSYDIARKYTDRVVLYHDWAIDVLMQDRKKIKGQDEMQSTTDVVFTQPYVMVNMIPKHTNQNIIAQFHEWMQNYPDYQIINFPAERGDVLPDEIITQYADRIQTRQRWEHDLSRTLSVFQQADAGFGQRLHFIIPCVYYDLNIFHLSYSEKVDKILHYFKSMEF